MEVFLCCRYEFSSCVYRGDNVLCESDDVTVQSKEVPYVDLQERECNTKTTSFSAAFTIRRMRGPVDIEVTFESRE